MDATQKYTIVDFEKGLLDRSIFTDEQTYQEELEKVSPSADSTFDGRRC